MGATSDRLAKRATRTDDTSPRSLAGPVVRGALQGHRASASQLVYSRQMLPVVTPGEAHGLRIGQTIGGKYRIVRLLGEGGMAYVFEASHERLQQRVAIKLLAPEFARDPELVQRFEREARAVARLKTRHVARVMDVDATIDGIPYIVMEFLQGNDVEAELEARVRLPLEESVDYVLQVCAGMLEAHGMGIVHRDLKPANLFLAHEGDEGERIVKVLDFGISKVVGEATRLTGAGAVMGTVLYMSPEQVRAQPNVDTRADIWALGVILYELLAGRTPWEGASHQIAAQIVSRDPADIRTFIPVPEGVAATLRTMLQRDPAGRFANVREVLAALAPYAPAGSIGAAVAEQSTIVTSSRQRASGSGTSAPMISAKHTIPMSSRPGALEAAMAAAAASRPPSGTVAFSNTGPLPSTPTAIARPAPTGDVQPATSRSLLLVIAVVIGLVGAAGVVLIVIATMQKNATAGNVDASASAAPSTSTSSSPASMGSSLPQSATTSSSSVAPPPPATGTSGRSPAPPHGTPGSKRGADAGKSSSTPGSPAPAGTPPSFL